MMTFREKEAVGTFQRPGARAAPTTKAPVKGKGKTKAPPAKAAGQTTIGFARTVSNPISRKRSLQQIEAEVQDFDNSPWGDTDDEYIPSGDDDGAAQVAGREDDPIELDETDVDDDMTPVAPKRRKSGDGRRVVSAPTAPASASRDKGRKVLTAAHDSLSEVEPSPFDQCFAALKAVVKSVSVGHIDPVHHLISDIQQEPQSTTRR